MNNVYYPLAPITREAWEAKPVSLSPPVQDQQDEEHFHPPSPQVIKLLNEKEEELRETTLELRDCNNWTDSHNTTSPPFV